jgi:hypothetical protein
MSKPKLKLSENQVSQEIDLKKYLGSLAKDESVREVFFQLAFEKMIERLDDGKDVNGKAMVKYSKEYKDSLAYAAFSKDGTVNMTLSGDMVNSVSIKSQNSNKMVVGFDGKEQNAKAFAHITGFEGHPTIKGAKPREFFGWTDKELSQISKELKPANDSKSIISDEKLIALLDRLVGSSG